MIMKRLNDYFKGKYEIRYTTSYDVIIHGKINVEDFLIVRRYLKMYRLYYRNLVVESW